MAPFFLSFSFFFVFFFVCFNQFTLFRVFKKKKLTNALTKTRVVWAVVEKWIELTIARPSPFDSTIIADCETVVFLMKITEGDVRRLDYQPLFGKWAHARGGKPDPRERRKSSLDARELARRETWILARFHKTDQGQKYGLFCSLIA